MFCWTLCAKKRRRRELTLFLGFLMLSFYILFYRNKETASHKTRESPSTENWWPGQSSFYTEDESIYFSATQMEKYEQRKDRICGQKWQEEYKKLHRDILQSRRPRQFIVLSCNEPEEYNCAGYGNRLQGMASLLFLSILTQRAFIIEWDEAAR
ncbi:hypothetical protein OS493_015685 [Desmophyllum pertusum]|uniref:Uncharacterized protein n=1 Tax=Desmophyllum pertusum TaxID=174260 RepID=A0A9X0CKZ0_9CNID|nr:hypothetical protein OS493_015685 [Desmophyllum pertusum]